MINPCSRTVVADKWAVRHETLLVLQLSAYTAYSRWDL